MEANLARDVALGWGQNGDRGEVWDKWGPKWYEAEGGWDSER